MTTVSSTRATVLFPNDRQVLIARSFAASKELSTGPGRPPELVRRWWGANRGEVTVAAIDLRVGGRWRYVLVTPRGHEVAFRGEYRELVENERIVSTELYEAMPDEEALSTITFTEEAGLTTLTILVEHASTAARDAHIAAGMEAGVQDALAACSSRSPRRSPDARCEPRQAPTPSPRGACSGRLELGDLRDGELERCAGKDLLDLFGPAEADDRRAHRRVP